MQAAATHTTGGTTGGPARARRLGALVALGLMGLAVAVPASASADVKVGGKAICKGSPLPGSQAASSVSIRLDDGQTTTVNTSSSPWSAGLYRSAFPSMPRNGIGATLTVTCNGLASSPGPHTYRVFYKPNWRNTTGNRNFTVR